MSDPRSGPTTRAVHAGHLDNPFGAVSTPIYQSATFGYPSLAAMIEAFKKGPAGVVYTRYANPTILACEAKLADHEGAEAALVFSSGMAAITSTLFSLLRPGDRIACLREIYGGTFEFLSHWADRLDWIVDWVATADADGIERVLTPDTKVVYAESPTNPLLRLVDLERLAARAHAVGAVLVVDNTFATGHLQRPIELGADLVCHSATKYLGGHGDLVAGAAMGSRARMDALWKVRKILGGVMDPQAAWLLERSVMTLPLRVERASQSAAAIAAFLARHAFVQRVHYPGLASHPDHALAGRQMKSFGAMVTVELAGDLAASARFVDSLRLFHLAASLGGVESLVSVPAASSHFALTPAERAAAGVTDGMVRLSVGIEDEADLIADLEQALERAAQGVEARQP